MGTAPDRAWWKEAVVYEIYPRSFNDSDGDGFGDLPGVLEKVDYLDDLGVDVVWLCPVYDSPNRDNGYDIRDYRTIQDTFGTMADWEALLDELHARDIRLIMDLVVNHTSSDHEWFQRSRRRDGAYEDYYHWVEGTPDEPPNNWTSFFGGSAWAYDEVREAWYLHLFHETQPDLNWRTPAVREAVRDIVRWWLEKGIDGFRMDAINLLSKPTGYPEGDPTNVPVGSEHFFNGPRLVEYLGDLYDDVLADYDAFTIGEMAKVDADLANELLGPAATGIDAINHFDHLTADTGPKGRWDHEGWGDFDLPAFKRIMARWQTDLADTAWPASYLGNHDQPRVVSRFGDVEQYHYESATLIATFLLTARGTPLLYQGDEIGMTNSDFETLDELDDPETIGTVQDLRAAGEIDSFEEIRTFVNYMSRDHARTPMQWTADENAGFSTGDPWFPVNDDYERVNVAAARAADRSVWHYYRELIRLRGTEDVLVYGDHELHLPAHEQLYVYHRRLENDAVLVALNWSTEPATVPSDALPAVESTHSAGRDTDATVLLGNYDDPPAPPAGERLRPYEAVVYRR